MVIRLIILIMLTGLILLPVGCSHNSYDKGYGVGYKEGYERGLQEGKTLTEGKGTQSIDNPTLPDKEVCAIIWSQLALALPNDYKIDQFDRNTRNAQYAGNGIWKFKVTGSGEDKKELPCEITKKSDILWLACDKEEVTSFNLLLEADFYEALRYLEIQTIDKFNVKTTVQKKSERPMQAKLRVGWYKTESLGALQYRFSGEVRNVGLIPITGAKVVASWGYTIRETPLCTTDISRDLLTVLPDHTAQFIIVFAGESISYPDDFRFIASDGAGIPFEIAPEFEKNS